MAVAVGRNYKSERTGERLADWNYQSYAGERQLEGIIKPVGSMPVFAMFWIIVAHTSEGSAPCWKRALESLR